MANKFLSQLRNWSTLRNILIAVLVGVLEYLRQSGHPVPPALALLLAAFGIRPATNPKN